MPDYEGAAAAEVKQSGDDDGDDEKKENNQEEKPDVNHPTDVAAHATVSGAFKLGRANLKVNRKGWVYLHEETLSKVVQFVQELFNHGEVSSCRKVILSGGMNMLGQVCHDLKMWKLLFVFVFFVERCKLLKHVNLVNVL